MSRGQASIVNSLRSHLPHASRVLLGVSGGIDSIVLLHAAEALARELELHLEVAHIDHGLRAESAADADFVDLLCKQKSIPFHLHRASKKPEQENTESWGRRVRYDFFAEILATRNLNLLATAHHADDVAETLLMRLVSNKDPGEVSRFDARRKLVRPLLDVPRALIESYAAEHGLTWRNDVSNSDEAFLRNKVRRSLLPLLQQQFDPRMVEVLSLRAQGLAEDLSALDAWASSEAQRLETLSFGSRDWLTATRAILSALEPAVQWRVARDLLAEPLGFRLGRLKAQPLVAFLLGESQGMELPSGLRLRRHEGGITLLRPS